MLKPTPTLDYSDSLPSELLCEIFLSVLALNKSFSVANIAELECFRQVSKKWERTVVSHPELWTSIQLDCTIDGGSVATSSKQLLSHHSTGKIKHIKEMARRLKRRCFPNDDQRLEAELVHKAIMDITHYARLSNSSPLSLSLKLPCREEAIDLDFLKLGRPVVDRVRRLELTLSTTAAFWFSHGNTNETTSNEPTDSLSGMESEGWPQLEDLRLVIPYDGDQLLTPGDYPRRTLPNPKLVGKRRPLMPRLTSLTLQMYALNEDIIDYIRSLSQQFPITQLTHLEIDRISDWHGHWFSESLAIAAECRAHLEDLRLGFSRQHRSELVYYRPLLVDGTITFPRLKVLHLRVYHTSPDAARDGYGDGLDQDLSRALTLPSLQELSIAYRPSTGSLYGYDPRIREAGMEVPTLTSLLSHCEHGLRKLCLTNICFDEAGIDIYSHILSHGVFRNLETLHLVDDFLPFYSFMTDKIDDCTFLPRLRHVELCSGSQLSDNTGNLKEGTLRAYMFYKSRPMGKVMIPAERLPVVRHGLDCKTCTACRCVGLPCEPRIVTDDSTYAPIKDFDDRI
ncbi:hypothetical protein D9611_006707 [Ephemerocybe angulata]|uniref:F-box domain-containing protein n=1 Tax=Ephemerocybe angulata TaxID=980116 RepID=A0A8H5FGN8_9AGAR|nr:hypothetical protein D9611_006707 [Tulosesus angulatus]